MDTPAGCKAGAPQSVLRQRCRLRPGGYATGRSADACSIIHAIPCRPGGGNSALRLGERTGAASQGQCGYAISHPADMQLTSQGTYSWILGASTSEPSGPVPNFVYISVIPEGFQGEAGEIYNHDPVATETLLKMQVGESKPLRERPAIPRNGSPTPACRTRPSVTSPPRRMRTASRGNSPRGQRRSGIISRGTAVPT